MDKKPESHRRTLIPQSSYQYYSGIVKSAYISTQHANHIQPNQLDSGNVFNAGLRNIPTTERSEQRQRKRVPRKPSKDAAGLSNVQSTSSNPLIEDEKVLK